LKPIDLSQGAPWKARYRANKIVWASIAAGNPQRGVACTNLSGVLQLHAWDVAAGELSQVTYEESGVLFGSIAADGNHIYFLKDEGGDERGHFVRVPFEGGEPEDISPHMPDYASFVVNESGDSRVLAFLAAVSKQGFRLVLMTKLEDGTLSPPREIWQSGSMCQGPALSQDGAMVVVGTTERSGTTALGLVAIDSHSGEVIAELHDEGASILPGRFSRLAGDGRFLCTSNWTGFARPFLWDVMSGKRYELPMPDVAGELQAWDWSHDGKRLLLNSLYRAEYQLYTYDLAQERLNRLDNPSGTIGYYFGGEFTASGDLLASWQDATHPSRMLLLDGETGRQRCVALSAGEAPAGRAWRSVTFPTVDGMEIQAWVATPEGEGPFPTILHTHGGPTAVMTETFLPESQAWLDHGFAFMTVNYRGSTTFGKAFEEAIWGDLGRAEVEDMAVARDWLVENGTGVAVADWRLMYEDQAETLRGYLRGLLLGTPDEKPEAYAHSSPISYVEQVSSPVLVIQGRNDSRCPPRQLEAYECEMRAAGRQIEVEWFDAGHGSRGDEQQIDHQTLKLRFAHRVLG
jgi:dipeptidyl aminopeptidase/acylaminoacyl peptidase